MFKRQRMHAYHKLKAYISACKSFLKNRSLSTEKITRHVIKENVAVSSTDYKEYTVQHRPHWLSLFLPIITDDMAQKREA